MHPFVAASPNPFDLKAALLAGHAHHPVIIHFPIALFIASAVFEVMAVWRKKSVFATVAYYNLLGAALTVPLAIATGLGAWQWQLEGNPQGQLTAAYDVRANFGVPNLPSLLDALAAPGEECLARCRLCRSDIVRSDG